LSRIQQMKVFNDSTSPINISDYPAAILFEKNNKIIVQGIK